MNFLGVGMYTNIAQPGDFAYRVDGERWLLAMHCPKFRVCYIAIHKGPAGDTGSARLWEWDGNVEAPTIKPSIGCDAAPRCGAHRTITDGQIL